MGSGRRTDRGPLLLCLPGVQPRQHIRRPISPSQMKLASGCRQNARMHQSVPLVGSLEITLSIEQRADRAALRQVLDSNLKLFLGCVITGKLSNIFGPHFLCLAKKGQKLLLGEQVIQIYTNLLTFHTLERTNEWLALEDSPFKKYYYIVLYVSVEWRPEDNYGSSFSPILWV